MEASTGTPKSARWQESLPKTRTSAVSAGAAMLLHVAAGAVLLAMVRSPVVPKPPEEETVAFAFAPLQSMSPEPPAPAAMPDPPPPAAKHTSAAAPVAQPSSPEPLPPPPTETKSHEAAPPIEHPPVVRQTTPRVKPVAPPHIATPPAAIRPQPTEAPPNQPTSRSSVAEATVASDWQRSLATWLAAHKTYPDEARRGGIEGKVALRLTVDRSGRVLDVVLVRSAGSPTLDAAAEAMVRNAVLPPFTAGMSQDAVKITIQLHYALTN